MKNLCMWSRRSVLPVACVMVGLSITCDAAWAKSPNLFSTDVFVADEDGYFAYRIPCLVATGDGKLLAFVEARKNNLRDPGGEGQEIDLAVKDSRDGGQTWSAMRLVEDAPELWSAANPSAAVDRSNGRIWLFYLRCKPGRGTHTARPGTDDVRTLARFSDDNGRTWSEPIDLTRVARDFDDPKWKLTVPGPGGAIQTRSGRLLIPCWRYAPFRNFVLYSDDHGKTWHRSLAVPGEVSINENQVVELSDGRILMDSRQSGGPHRWMSESCDGGRSWSEPRPGQTVTPVMCSIERLSRPEDQQRCRLIWTGPAGPGRRKLTLWVSYDQGRSFQNPHRIYEGFSAYSDLAILNGGQVGILWERGETRGYQFVTFTRVDSSWVDQPIQPVLDKTSAMP